MWSDLHRVIINRDYKKILLRRRRGRVLKELVAEASVMVVLGCGSAMVGTNKD